MTLGDLLGGSLTLATGSKALSDLDVDEDIKSNAQQGLQNASRQFPSLGSLEGAKLNLEAIEELQR